MKYRKFGSTDFKVSALGLGCMRLPVNKIFPMKVNVPDAINLIRSAIDQGVNYLDTAWPYHFGESETVVGKALRDGYREKVHLVSKLPMFAVSKTEDFDRFLNGQLKKLQTDHLDTYLFHSMNKNGLDKVKNLGLIDKMIEAKKNGLINHIGFSFHDTLPVFKEIVDLFDWDMVQIQYNYMDTGVQATTDGLKYAASKGMAVVIMEPLKGGTLANPPKEAKEIINSAEVKRTSVDWALQFLWNLPEVSLVLSGMGNQKMLDENCESAKNSGIGSLNKADLNTIEQLTEIYRKKILIPCTACQYCMPCPFGVNIPQNFAIVNNVSTESNFIFRQMLKMGYRHLTGKKSKLNKEKPNGNATICTECGVCLEKCPQEIQIPDELKKVNAVLGEKKKISRVFNV
ncbi:MAG: aldo/keto reductase [Spirochaetaceae bacterium]|jgi:predicted aldo/keto reductase-like oxidoreductase|nr:aldo/keto reductase [Spirochaetaceae bacterium]